MSLFVFENFESKRESHLSRLLRQTLKDIKSNNQGYINEL